MTARAREYQRRQAENKLVSARCHMIRRCCSVFLGIEPEFHGDGRVSHAGLSVGGTKLEININSGAWSSTSSLPGEAGVGELSGPAGFIDGTEENFVQVLKTIFPRLCAGA